MSVYMIGIRGKCSAIQKVYEVDCWPKATGDSDVYTFCGWSDIIAGQDRRYQGQICVRNKKVFDSGRRHLGDVEDQDPLRS